MLISNLWTNVGLVNGAMGPIQAICYHGGGPPYLLVAVMVHFYHYIGPTELFLSLPFTRLGQHLDPSTHDFNYLSNFLWL